jgi:hypothetical protein
MALVTLCPFVPIYLLLDFKFGHFGNPLVSIPSGFIFLLSFWLQTLDCPTLYPEEWKWLSTARSQARAIEDYIGLMGVTLKKLMFCQTSWERCLHQEYRSFSIWPILRRFPFSVEKRYIRLFDGLFWCACNACCLLLTT